jgi:uncharacterized protein (DUF488 family)
MLELMTIGYEGLTLQEFFTILERCRVKTIIDVREMPLSRKKGFSKTALSLELAKRGISYSHIQALGCPKPVRNDYRNTGNWASYTVRFMEYLQTQEEVMQDVAGVIQNERCCLLCFEEDYNFCHRRYIAEELIHFLPGQFKINHLTGPISGRVVVQGTLAAA